MATKGEATARKRATSKRATSKSKSKEVPSFGIDWRSLYLYAVSLITLLICLFTLISLIKSGFDLAVPDVGYVDPYAINGETKIDPEVIRAANIDQNRRNSIRNIFGSIITLAVTAPVYIYHWRKVRN